MLLRSPLDRLPPLAIAVALLTTPCIPAHAASVLAVATVGQPAPGGGIFAGPGFLGRPAAAGDGWVAFRATVAPSGSTEELVLANMNPARSTRISVARTGELVSEALGTIHDFIGNPAVNVDGDVAFIVTLNPPEAPAEDDPQPAALLLYDTAAGERRVLATAGVQTPVGRLALAEGLGGTTPTLDARTPSVDDDGDVAFTALGIDGETETPAVFLLQNGTLTVAAQAGDETANSIFQTFGPPALNVVDHVAFRATLDGPSLRDGVFLWRDGNLTLIARNGDTVVTTEPESMEQTLAEFAPVLDLAADDTIAFAAGPLVDFTFGPDSTASAFGVLTWRDGALDLVTFPGQSLGERGRVTDLEILPQFGAALVPPRLLPDGGVFFHVELNGGSSGVIARASDGGAPTEIAAAGGGAPSATPLGGSFAAFTIPPTVDGTGTPVVVAELQGAPTSDALIWGVGGGPSQAIAVGEPSPGTGTGGFLGGPSFVDPTLTESGDVFFRSTTASGPSAIGLYRWRRGELTVVVRGGDPAPVPGDLPFLGIVGQHDANDDGTVIFAAIVEGLNRGIYAVSDDGVVSRVAAEGDTVRILSGTVATFDAILPNPAIASDGTMAFRARVSFEQSGSARRRSGIFLRSGSQVRAAVLEDEAAPGGETFRLFREVAVGSDGEIAFIADVGDEVARRGLFFADQSGVRAVLVEGDRLDGDLVTGFLGGPEVNDRGTIAQLARIESGVGEDAVLLRGTPARVDVVARVGDESPAGGTYRSLGRPAINRSGDVAFRATFEPGTGGSPGLLTATETTVEPAIGIGDPGPATIGGQFVGFNQRLSLNAEGGIAFLGSLAGGDVRDGVFLGEPATLTVPKLRMKVGTNTRPDRMKLKTRMSSSTATRAIDVAASRVRITIQDDAGARWTETISPGGFRKRRRAFVYTRKPTVRKVKIKIAKSGVITAVIRANPDLTGGGLFPIQPPMRVDFEIADVSGRTSVNCLVSARRVRCR